MKTLIFSKDNKIAKDISKLIKKYNEEMEVEVVETAQECYEKCSGCSYAFVSDTDDGTSWEDLIRHISENGVNTYFITDADTGELFDKVRQAGGKRAIAYGSLENDIKIIMKAAKKEAGVKENQETPAVAEKKVKTAGKKRAAPKEDKETEEDGDEEHAAGEDEENQDEEAGFDIVRLKDKKYPGVIISIHGAKGGVGKTTISANIAVALALFGLKTVIVDLDVENGNLASVLHVSSPMTIKDWVKGNVYEEDGSLAVHDSGLNVLQGIKIPAEASLITAPVTERILARLARRFDIVVVDTGAVEINPMLVAMQMAEKGYIIADYDLTRAQNLSNLLNDAKALGIDLEKMKGIINAVPEKRPARREDLLENIPIPILTEIRRDDAVPIVANEGGVPYTDRRCKKFSEDLFPVIVDILEATGYGQKLEQEPVPKKKGGLFGWLRF